MKYTSPKIELSMLETKDIITTSSDKFEVEENGNGKGKVSFKASDLFK